MFIEGDVSVKAALLGQKREIDMIYMDDSRHDKNAHFIEMKAKELHVPFERTARSYIDDLATGRTHGGLIAQVEPRRYDALKSVFTNDMPFVVFLEGVEDPFNLGYIMRSLYSAGCNGLILKKRDWTNVEPVILKSSAGAFDYINTVLVEDTESMIHTCMDQGLHVYAAMRKDAKPYFEANFKRPILLMIGGEMRGLSSKSLALADENIYVPYANDFRNALNAAGAAAVLGFEVMKQRI